MENDQERIDNNSLVSLFQTFQSDPFFWIEQATGLVPQPPKAYKLPLLNELLTCPLERFEEIAGQLTLDDFEPFKRGKHLTWQQTIILIAYARALTGSLPRRMAVMTGRGLGKAVALDEIVWRIENGVTKPVLAKDIVVGDVVLGKEKPTTVVGVFPQETSMLYRVTFDDGESVVVNGEHLWEVSDVQIKRKLDKRQKNREAGTPENIKRRRGDDKEWEVITTNEMIQRGLYFGSSKPMKRFRIPVQKIQGHVSIPDAYIVGVWYGDGNRSKSCAAYTKPDEFIAEKIKSLGVGVGETKNVNSVPRTLYGYINRLKELNVPTETKNNLPTNFLSWDYESRLELLRGLMDTDGTIGNGVVRPREGNRKPSATHHCEFSTSIPELANDVALLVRSLGGKTNIRIKKITFYRNSEGKKVYCQPSYRIKVTLPINPFSLPRKADLWKPVSQDRYINRFVDSIQAVEEKESVCFKVDADDSLFLIGKGLIVTHNTKVVSLIICHFLYSFARSLIMATAPTGDQLFSALWKEANVTIADMRSPFKEVFEWQTTFIRHKEDPYGWFARAKTAETIEALRGLHADSMLAVCDEASGIADEIIHNGWATMTNENKVMILISNTSGNDSLIERVFEENDDSYVKLSFSAEHSPIVDQVEIARRKRKLEDAGVKPEDDRDYRIDILGLPPKDASEFVGWYRFFPDTLIDNALREVGPLDTPDYRQRPALGVDPAGEGSDTAPGVLRGFKWAKTIFEQAKSSSDSIAGSIAVVLDNVPQLTASRVFIDSFGVGHDVGQKVLANSSENKRRVVRAVLVGEPPMESYRGRYVNVRAMLYDAMRVWFENGGRIETGTADVWRKELKSIYAKKTASGKLQIMGKAEMRAKGLRSPNNADALALSFYFDAPMVIDGIYRPVQTTRADGYGYTPPPQNDNFNRHDLIPNSF